MLLTSKDREILAKQYLGLSIISEDTIEGVIYVKARYYKNTKQLVIDDTSEESLEGKYKIKIKLFPNKFPEVYEMNGDLQRGLDLHIYDDGKFCLTHTLFENKYKNSDLEYILENFIIPFLHNQNYNKKHREFLWEYGHSYEGTFEYIYDNCISRKDYMKTLQSLNKLIGMNKGFLYSNNEKAKVIDLLNLKSNKSIQGFEKFRIYLKQNTNLFKKIKIWKA